MATFFVPLTCLYQVKERKGKSLTSNCPGGSAPGKESNSYSRPNQSSCFPLRILIMIAFLSWKLPTRKGVMPQIDCQKHMQRLGIIFQRLSLSACSRVKPVSYAWYGPDEDTTNFVFLFFVGGIGKAEGLMFISTECRAEYHHWPQQPLALCWTAKDGKSASANPHSRPFPNSKSLLHYK